jgi:tRNA threonylcarbamoyladenosine biosynthesis protein TsaB
MNHEGSRYLRALRGYYLSDVLILALDTTTSAGSSALMRDGRVVCEQASDSSRAQAERLPGELAALLEHESVALSQIDALAVGIGPGSFTGLRVGIATMQGLAVALHRPLFGVSAFDALARIAYGRSRDRMRVATWVDAWRGEVYAALYQDGREVEPPTVDGPGHLLTLLAGHPTFFTGDGAAVNRVTIETALGRDAQFAEPVTPVLAGAMAALAYEEFQLGLRPLPHAIRPLYVRRSDAELARDRS